jgi:hypothetical protein
MINLLCFVLGGFVTLSLFYPKHKKWKDAYISKLISYSYWFGVHVGQYWQGMPNVYSIEIVDKLSKESAPSFNYVAKIILEKINK